MSNVLYVVCHGLISVFQKEDASFTALMIKMEGHHYLAGSWLNETQVQPANLKLTGVSDDATGLPPDMLGSASLDPAKNIVLQIGQIPAAATPDIRTRIDLPKPVAVHSFFTTATDVDFEVAAGVVVGESRKVSGVQVFVYSVPAGSTPALHPHAWVGTPRGISPRVTVLHLFNEPNAELLAKPLAALTAHNQEEFDYSAKVLGVAVKLKKRIEGPPPTQTMVLPELLALELQPRSAREKTVVALTHDLVAAASGVDQTGPITVPIGTDAANCNGCNGI